MSDVVQAKNAALMINVSGTYYLIGCQTDFSYDYSNDNILKTDVNAGSYKKRRTRISDVAGSAQGVVTTTNTGDRVTIFYLQQESIRRSIVQLKFSWTDDDGGIKEITGRFCIKTIHIDDATNDFSKFDVQFEGAGDGVSIDPVIPPEPGSDEGLDSDVWGTTEGVTTITGTGEDGKSFSGKTIFMVAREGAVYFPESPLATTTGYSFDGTTITFLNPFLPGERVTVAWHD